MTYLLDTSVLIDLLRQKLQAWDFINQHKDSEICTCAICEAEVWEGVYREEKSQFAERKKAVEDLFSNLKSTVSFDSSQAIIAGQIRATLSLKGQNIGDLDILIAAAAIATNAVLVTKNPKHFSRIENLQAMSI